MALLVLATMPVLLLPTEIYTSSAFFNYGSYKPGSRVTTYYNGAGGHPKPSQGVLLGKHSSMT